MKRYFPLITAALALLVSACGPTTKLTLIVDVAALLPNTELQGDAPLQSGLDLKLPPEGIASSELGLPQDAFAGLEQFSLDMTADFTLADSSEPLSATLAIYISDSDDVYAATPFEVSVDLTPGITRAASFSLNITAQDNSNMYELLQGGDFTLGVAIKTDGTADTGSSNTVSAELTALDLRVTADTSQLMPF